MSRELLGLDAKFCSLKAPLVKSHQDVIEKFGLRDVRTKAIEAKLSTLSQAGVG